MYTRKKNKCATSTPKLTPSDAVLAERNAAMKRAERMLLSDDMLENETNNNNVVVPPPSPFSPKKLAFAGKSTRKRKKPTPTPTPSPTKANASKKLNVFDDFTEWDDIEKETLEEVDEQ